MIVGIIQACILMLCAVLLHELGHFFYARYYLKVAGTALTIQDQGRFTIRTTVPKEYTLTNKQTSGFISSGIILGALPLFLANSYMSSRAMFLVGVFYLVGCRADIKQLWRIK